MSFDEESLHSTVEKKLTKNVRVMLITNSSVQQISSLEDLKRIQTVKNESTQIFMSKHLFNPNNISKDNLC